MLNGVLIDSLSVDNTLSGDFIGTNASGEAAIGNGAVGVSINGAGANALIRCQFANNPFVYYNVISENAINILHITSSDSLILLINFFSIYAQNSISVSYVIFFIFFFISSLYSLVLIFIPLLYFSSIYSYNLIYFTLSSSFFTTFYTFLFLLSFYTSLPNFNYTD